MIMKQLFFPLICLFLALAFVASCGAGPGPSSGGGSSSAGAPPQASPAPGGSFAAEPDASRYSSSGAPQGGIVSGAAPQESAVPLPILTPSEAEGRKLMYTVTVQLQTTDFMAGIRKLQETVIDIGGFVLTADVRGRDIRTPEFERSADYRFRIPSERLSEFLVVMEDNFNLLRLQQETEDSTTDYQSADTRLEDLREQERRLLDSMSAARNTNERLELEARLDEIQKSINEYLTLQFSVDDSVILSTVVIYLFEVIIPDEVEEEPEPPLTFSDRLSNRISASINGFVSFCQGLLLVVIAISPVLLVLIILAAVALLIVRIVTILSKKIKREKPESIREKPPEDSED